MLDRKIAGDDKK